LFGSAGAFLRGLVFPILIRIDSRNGESSNKKAGEGAASKERALLQQGIRRLGLLREGEKETET